MSQLVLIKHSLPAIFPAVPSAEWRLSEEGVRRCGALARHCAAPRIEYLVSSAEPKAAETARLVADCIGVGWEIQNDLHENDRTGFPFLETEAWKRAFAEFFAHP